MRKKRDPLIELIKSLSTSEKGYFIKYAKRHQLGDQNDYLWLFNQLNKSEILDWENIEKKIPKGTFKSGKYKAKSRLYVQILKSMSAFSEEATPANRINKMLTEAEFLRKKGLKLQYKKKIFEVKEFSLKYHQLSYLPIIYEAESLISFHGNHPLTDDEIINEKLDVLKKLMLSIQCYRKIKACEELLLSDSEHWSEREEKKLKKNIDFISTISINQISLPTYLHARSVQIRYYDACQKREKAIVESENCIKDLFRIHENVLDVFPLHFFYLYHTILCTYLTNHAGPQIESLWSIQKKLNLNKEWSLKLDMISNPLFLNYYLRTDDLQRAESMVKAFEKIKKVHFRGFWVRMLEYQYTMNAFYYFLIRDYQKCLFTIDQWNDLDSKAMKEFEVISLFISCLCLHILNEVPLLDSRLGSMHHLVYKNKSHNYPISKILYRVIKAITQPDKHKDLNANLESYNTLKVKEKNKVYNLFDVTILLRQLK